MSLSEVCTGLGLTVRIHPEAVARAARAITAEHGGATAWTAGERLVAAFCQAIITALAAPDARELLITPDPLTIP